MSPQVRTEPRAGFTLVEMIAVATILSIVGLVAGVVLTEATKVYANVTPALEATYEGNLAVARIKQEVRETSDLSSIVAMEPQRFAFTNNSAEVVEFEARAGELFLNGDLLARNVTAFRFQYWDRGGSATVDPAALHLVEVDLTVDRVGRPFRFQTAVFPRCVTP